MITYRRVEPADLPEVSRLGIESKRSWGYSPSEMEIFARELTLDETMLAGLFAAEIATEGTEIVGYFTIRQHADGTDELEHLFVRAGRFGEGIGADLFARALTIAASAGLQKITIIADPNSAGFYEKLGAEKIGDHQSSIAGRTIPIYSIEI